MAQTFQFQISGRRLLLGLLLTVVPVSLLALYSATNVGREFENLAGANLRSAAQDAASSIQERIRAKVVEAALMASDSAVIDAVVASNQRYGRTSDAQILERIEAQDAVWNSTSGQILAERMLANSSSQALRRYLALDPDFIRIFVTDLHGASIAGSHKTLDFNQADEQWWQDVYSSGRGSVSLTDVLYDFVTHHQYIGVGVPVINENHILIGILHAFVDISSLAPLVNRADLAGGRMALVKSDGSIIAGSGGVSATTRAQSADHAAIQDAASNFEGLSAGFVKAAFPDRQERLVAFAETGLLLEFRNLDWTVVASQDTSVVLGPVTSSQGFIMLIALLTLATVVFVAVYFSLHRQSEIEELEELRHSGQAV